MTHFWFSRTCKFSLSPYAILEAKLGVTGVAYVVLELSTTGWRVDMLLAEAAATISSLGHPTEHLIQLGLRQNNDREKRKRKAKETFSGSFFPILWSEGLIRNIIKIILKGNQILKRNDSKINF